MAKDVSSKDFNFDDIKIANAIPPRSKNYFSVTGKNREEGMPNGHRWLKRAYVKEQTNARSSDDENIYDQIVIIPMTVGPCSDCESDNDQGDKGQYTRSLHSVFPC